MTSPAPERQNAPVTNIPTTNAQPQRGAKALPPIADIAFDKVAQEIVLNPATQLSRGMGYRYERPNKDKVNDVTCSVERARVKSLQGVLNALKEEGEKDLVPDGIFGPETAAALKRVQQKLGLDPTGKVDAQTAQALVQAASHSQPPAPAAAQGRTNTAATNAPGADAKTQALNKLEELTEKYYKAASSDPNSAEAKDSYAAIQKIIGPELSKKLDEVYKSGGAKGVTSALVGLIKKGRDNGAAPQAGSPQTPEPQQEPETEQE